LRLSTVVTVVTVVVLATLAVVGGGLLLDLEISGLDVAEVLVTVRYTQKDSGKLTMALSMSRVSESTWIPSVGGSMALTSGTYWSRRSRSSS
jgi:hypothetical protein